MRKIINNKLYLKIAASRQQRVCRRLAVTTARHSFRLVSEVIEVLRQAEFQRSRAAAGPTICACGEQAVPTVIRGSV